MFGGLVNHTYQQQNTSTLVHFCYATGCCFYPFISVLSCITLVYIEPPRLVMCSFISKVHTKRHQQCIACFHNNHFFKAFFAICVNVTIFCSKAVNECNSFKILPFPRSNYSLIVFHFHRCPVMKISRQCFKLPVVCLWRYLEANNEIDQPISDVACQ